MNWCGLFWGWMCKIYPLSYYALTDMSVLKTYLDQFLCRVTFYSFIYSLTQVRVDCPASLYQVVVFILNNVSFFVKLPPPPKKGANVSTNSESFISFNQLFSMHRVKEKIRHNFVPCALKMLCSFVCFWSLYFKRLMSKSLTAPSNKDYGAKFV